MIRFHFVLLTKNNPKFQTIIIDCEGLGYWCVWFYLQVDRHKYSSIYMKFGLCWLALSDEMKDLKSIQCLKLKEHFESKYNLFSIIQRWDDQGFSFFMHIATTQNNCSQWLPTLFIFWIPWFVYLLFLTVVHILFKCRE